MIVIDDFCSSDCYALTSMDTIAYHYHPRPFYPWSAARYYNRFKIIVVTSSWS